MPSPPHEGHLRQQEQVKCQWITLANSTMQLEGLRGKMMLLRPQHFERKGVNHINKYAWQTCLTLNMKSQDNLSYALLKSNLRYV